MIIQVCGITRPDQIPLFDAMLVHQIAMDFSADANNNKLVCSIDPEQIDSIDSDVDFVGVFNNQSLDVILSTAEAYRFTTIQLTGSESPNLCRELQKQHVVIKTISIDGQQPEDLIGMIELYDDVCDYFLVDLDFRAANPASTTRFPWDLLLDISVEKPFFIGGKGLRASDAPSLHQFRHPDFYGVSIHASFEHASAAGDSALIFSFIKAIQQVVN
ncbi:MAG: phosphoribosylanthranilate isomerase [Ferruginibacter sp.]